MCEWEGEYHRAHILRNNWGGLVIQALVNWMEGPDNKRFVKSLCFYETSWTHGPKFKIRPMHKRALIIPLGSSMNPLEDL